MMTMDIGIINTEFQHWLRRKYAFVPLRRRRFPQLFYLVYRCKPRRHTTIFSRLFKRVHDYHFQLYFNYDPASHGFNLILPSPSPAGQGRLIGGSAPVTDISYAVERRHSTGPGVMRQWWSTSFQTFVGRFIPRSCHPAFLEKVPGGNYPCPHPYLMSHRGRNSEIKDSVVTAAPPARFDSGVERLPWIQNIGPALAEFLPGSRQPVMKTRQLFENRREFHHYIKLYLHHLREETATLRGNPGNTGMPGRAGSPSLFFALDPVHTASFKRSRVFPHSIQMMLAKSKLSCTDTRLSALTRSYTNPPHDRSAFYRQVCSLRHPYPACTYPYSYPLYWRRSDKDAGEPVYRTAPESMYIRNTGFIPAQPALTAPADFQNRWNRHPVCIGSPPVSGKSVFFQSGTRRWIFMHHRLNLHRISRFRPASGRYVHVYRYSFAGYAYPFSWQGSWQGTDRNSGESVLSDAPGGQHARRTRLAGTSPFSTAPVLVLDKWRRHPVRIDTRVGSGKGDISQADPHRQTFVHLYRYTTHYPHAPYRYTHTHEYPHPWPYPMSTPVREREAGTSATSVIPGGLHTRYTRLAWTHPFSIAPVPVLDKWRRYPVRIDTRIAPGKRDISQTSPHRQTFMHLYRNAPRYQPVPYRHTQSQRISRPIYTCSYSYPLVTQVRDRDMSASVIPAASERQHTRQNGFIRARPFSISLWKNETYPSTGGGVETFFSGQDMYADLRPPPGWRGTRYGTRFQASLHLDKGDLYRSVRRVAVILNNRPHTTITASHRSTLTAATAIEAPTPLPPLEYFYLAGLIKRELKNSLVRIGKETATAKDEETVTGNEITGPGIPVNQNIHAPPPGISHQYPEHTDLHRLTDRVYRMLEDRIRTEKEMRGW